MAEEFLGKRVNLSFVEKKARVKAGKILEINDLGVVFQVDNYRKTGEAKSFLVLNDDITAISEAPTKKTTAKAKKTTKPEVVKPTAPKPEPDPPSTETVDSSDLVDDSEFDDVDDLDFDND